MATLEELLVQITAETSGLRAELAKATKATDDATKKMDDAIEEFSKNSSKNTGFFQTSMATLTGFLGSQAVLGAFNLVKDAAAFMGEQLIEGAKSAIAEEQSLTKLANALALSGKFSDEAMRSLTNYASEMENLTGVQDDVIASNLAVLSSMTKLDSEGLKKAQTAALDLAATYNVDLDTATKLVGKGIEGNVEAFKKYGISIEEGKNKTENLANILGALANTQGAAAGATQTFGGAITRATNSYGNFIEALANAITKNEAILGVLNEVSKIFNEMTGTVGDQTNAFKRLVGEGLVNVIDGLAILVTSFDALERIGGAVIDAVKMSFNGLGLTITGILGLFSDDFDDAFKHFTAESEAASKSFTENFSGDSMLGEVTTGLLRLKDAASEGLGAMKDGAEGVVEPTVAARDAVVALTEAQIENASKGKDLAEELIAQIEGTNETKLELMAEQQAAEQELLDSALDQKKISEEDYLAAVGELNTKYYKKASGDYVKYEQEKAKNASAYAQANINIATATANLITAIAGDQNKAAFIIAKGAAIAQAIVATNLASAQALAVPPAPNFALAGMAKTAGAINIAAIAATAIKGLQSGVDSIPGIGSRDSFPAMLAPGERVVPSKSNEDLTAFLEEVRAGEGNAGGKVTIELIMRDEFMEMIETKIIERQRVGVSLLRTT